MYKWRSTIFQKIDFSDFVWIFVYKWRSMIFPKSDCSGFVTRKLLCGFFAVTVNVSHCHHHNNRNLENDRFTDHHDNLIRRLFCLLFAPIVSVQWPMVGCPAWCHILGEKESIDSLTEPLRDGSSIVWIFTWPGNGLRLSSIKMTQMVMFLWYGAYSILNDIKTWNNKNRIYRKCIRKIFMMAWESQAETSWVLKIRWSHIETNYTILKSCLAQYSWS